MTKAEWGTKRGCTTCGARFYDLNKDPIICPKCGAENDKDGGAKSKRGGKGARNDAPQKASRKAAAAAADEDEDDELLVDDESDDNESDLMEDASDLGEDDDDMAEVIEHMEPGEKDE